jgi:nucleoside-diphosphate-sugar epimerase
MSRAALLTGATGFIGGKLATRLVEQGWQVHAVLRESSSANELPPQVTPHRHDGSVAGLTAIIRAITPDIVFHLASLYLADHRSDQIEDLVASNILFPAQLAEAMVSAGVTRLVNTGTAWQHFEGAAYNPVNLYAATKQACMDLLRYYSEACGLSVVTLKLFDTYGAGDKRRKLVQLLVDAAQSGEVLDMSPGEQVLDLTHVDDVVGAFVIAGRLLLEAKTLMFENYLVSGERLTVREIAAIVSEVLGRSVSPNFGGRPYRRREVMLPVEMPGAGTLPNWRRQHDLSATIAALDRLREDGDRH